jgi:hypothetical protein
VGCDRCGGSPSLDLGTGGLFCVGCIKGKCAA